jgi:hypothetical protein
VGPTFSRRVRPVIGHPIVKDQCSFIGHTRRSRSIICGRRERPLSEFTNGQFRAMAVLYRTPASG